MDKQKSGLGFGRSDEYDDKQSKELTEEQLVEMKHAFEVFDTDEDGFITSSDLAEVMEELGLPFTEKNLQQILKEVDTDHNGVIDFEEFLAIMIRKVKTFDTEDEIMAAFKNFDKDGDGYISHSDLKLYLRVLGEDPTDKEIAEMIEVVDLNHDGLVDYEEFFIVINSE